MLDQLVESKSNSKENARRSGFLLTIGVLMFSLLFGAWLYSLFAKDFGMGGSDLELSTLVAPVPVPEDKPPPPPEKEPEKVKAAPNADVRPEIIQRIDQTPVKPPETTSVVQNTVKPPREGIKTVIGKDSRDAENAAPSSYRGPVSTDGKGIAGSGGEPNTGKEGGAPPPPPPPPPPPAPPKPPVPKTISGGVVNSKARNLVTPSYPAAARAVRASGAVNVQVKIDEAGNVVSAVASSGHPLLRQAAEQAARASKFSPTLLSGQAVSVTGVIVYNFVP